MVWRTVICLIEFIYVVHLKANLQVILKAVDQVYVYKTHVRQNISWFNRDEIKQYNNNDFNVNLNVQAFSQKICKQMICLNWWYNIHKYRKKDENEFAPPLEFNIFKNIQQCSERELIYFFHQFVSVICTHSMAVYIYETWTDSSIKISQKHAFSLIHFKWEI